MSRPSAELVARYARAGQECIGPDWVDVLMREAAEYGQPFGIDPAVLLMYLAAGVIRGRLVKHLEEKHGPQGGDRWERSGAADVLAAIIDKPAELPTGPVKDRDEMHRRAAAMGIVIAR